jgi:hypothetical protein
MDQFPTELLGRAIQDPEFRHRLLAAPRDVAAAEGFVLDEHQLEALTQLDPDAVDDAIEALVGDLDGAKWG